MSKRKQYALRAVKAATRLVLLQAREEYQQKMVSLHLKQYKETEADLIEALTPVFEKHVERMAGGGGLDLDTALDEIINASLPVLAKGMEDAIRESFTTISLNEPMERTRQLAEGIKESTATQWLMEQYEEGEEITLPPGVSTEMPEWMQQIVTESLRETYSQDYWKKIPETTRDSIQRVIDEASREGMGIVNISKLINERFGSEYSRNRATLVARTEVAGALNAGRKGAIDRLARNVPEITSSWFSVMSPQTRDSHAAMHGELADEDGNFNLDGNTTPYPGHFSLPARDRCNCLCTVLTDFAVPANALPPEDTPAALPPPKPPKPKPPAAPKPPEPGKWNETTDRQLAVKQLRKLGGIPKKNMSVQEINRAGRNLSIMHRRLDAKSRLRLKKVPTTFEMSKLPEGVAGQYWFTFGELDGRLQISSNMPVGRNYPRFIKHPLIGPGRFDVDPSKAGTIRHEYAHHIHNKVIGREDREWWKLFKKYEKSDEVSAYGRTDHYEFFAESLCAATHPGYKDSRTSGFGRLPLDVEEFFNRRLGMDL